MPDMEKVKALTSLLEERSGLDVREALVEVTVKNAKGEVVSTRTLDKITPLGNLDMLDIQIDKPQLWDVDHPVLYTCEVTVTANGQKMTASERFGFRSFEFIDKGPFMLNGKRLLLRGTHRHEDHAGVAAAMTEEQMKALIEVANRYNPKNVQTKDNTGDTVQLFNTAAFAPPTAVIVGAGDGNNAYKSLLSKKIREGMLDKRVTELLRTGLQHSGKYPRHVRATAELMLAVASIARVIYIHGVEGTKITWMGPRCARNIDPGSCVLQVVAEYVQPLYQMGSYWLPAQGFSKGDRKHLGFDILPPVAKEEVKAD